MVRERLNAIVADYFVMLGAELRGEKYTKAKHNSAVMASTGRTHRSVEFKHQNISAVLEELGLPWIKGYKPKRNYQNAIFDAIDRYLSLHADILAASTCHEGRYEDMDALFVPTPPRTQPSGLVPERLRVLIRKFDPTERDRQNRRLGAAGEEFVFHLERRRLENSGNRALARKVRWVAAEDGDGAGYDVMSFDDRGREKLIEVKTTNGSAKTPFFVTKREKEVSDLRPDSWRIYRVHFFAQSPKIFTVAPPLQSAVMLTPETWRATF